MATSSMERLLNPEELRRPAITIRLMPSGRVVKSLFHIGGSLPLLDTRAVSRFSSDTMIMDTVEMSNFEDEVVWKNNSTHMSVVLI
jgi:hypothetical protein